MDVYTLTCSNCGQRFYSKEAFPSPQFCDTCLTAFKAGIKEVVEWITKESNKGYIFEGTYIYDTTHGNQLFLDLGDWQAFLKEKGVEQ